jgi:hypothetical protein
MLPDFLEKSCLNLISEPIEPECFFTIVVPARNESAHLPETLNSFSRQSDLRNRPLDNNLFEIIFFVNNTTDDSAEIIRRWQKKNPHINSHIAEKSLPAEHSNIGYVRRQLMNEAFSRLQKNKFGGGIIATTDADTQIAENWIAATIEEIKNGADAVGGRILIQPYELEKMDAKCHAFHLRDTGYRLMGAEIEAYLDESAHDFLPRHHQHFNGSFAVTTEAFAKAGGVPEVRSLEDVAFYHSLLRIDAKFRHSPYVRVHTSARLEGRTESGLSTQMNEWTVMGCNGDEYLVESAQSIERRLCARKRLREIWKNKKFQIEATNKIARDLLISDEFLKLESSVPQTFGSLYEKVLREQNRLGEWMKENPLVNVEKAIYDLRLMLEKLRRNSS